MEKKILLIDDDFNQHRINHFFFKKRGFKVVSAFSGQEGLKKLNHFHPELILLDFMMPGMDGESFLRYLWHDPEYQDLKDIPVVMLTAASHERKYVEKLLNIGLAAYLQKPFGEHELLNVVENVLVNHEKVLGERQNLQELQESYDFFENIIQNFPGILFTTTLDAKISFFSEGARPILHLSPSQVLGKKLFDIFNFPNEGFRNLLSRLKNDRAAIRQEVTIKQRNGREVPFELSLALFRDKKDRIAGILGLAKDLTAIKKLEEEKIERERITAIAQAMATVNHEINNPLTPILGNLDILLAEAALLPESVQKKLRTIRESAKRIERSVQKMRQISKPIFKEYYNGEMIIDLERSQ